MSNNILTHSQILISQKILQWAEVATQWRVVSGDGDMVLCCVWGWGHGPVLASGDGDMVLCISDVRGGATASGYPGVNSTFAGREAGVSFPAQLPAPAASHLRAEFLSSLRLHIEGGPYGICLPLLGLFHLT